MRTQLALSTHLALVATAGLVFGYGDRLAAHRDDSAHAVTRALTVLAEDAPAIDHYEGGQVKTRCKLDREGRLHGKFTEYYESGEIKVRTRYKKGKCAGKYASFHPDGADWIEANYTNGVLSGKYVERSADGERITRGKYKAGLRQGDFRVTVGGETRRVQRWKDGVLEALDGVSVHPRPLDVIRSTLAEIYDPTKPFGGTELGQIDQPSEPKRADRPEMILERDAVFRRLLAYRFLAGVAWRDMRVNARFNYHAEAAARLFCEAGSLDEVPENPGWPKKEFGHARLGALSCNRAYAPSLTEALDQGMAALGGGHTGFRTSFLDPLLLATGFGRVDQVNTLWYEDSSRTHPPDYDKLCFPPRGYMPREYFGPHHSWSVDLNPANHAPIAFKNDVQVRLYRLDRDWVRVGPALELESTTFYDRTISFHPVQTDCSVGARYEVQIQGIRHDKVGSALTYFVEFVDAAEQEQEGQGTLDPSGVVAY